jgi:thiol-disulfide isomerase/thioredoxin
MKADVLGSPFRFAGRIGQLFVSPRAALARIDARGGGLNDALWLVAVGVVAFRFPRLVQAVLGLAELSLGALGQLLGVVAGELQQAAWVVIPAALIITVVAGRRRDPSRDLELGAACYVPYFVIRGLMWLVGALPGGRAIPRLAIEIPAAAGALWVLVVAVAVARARQAGEPAKAAAVDLPARRGTTPAGIGALAVAFVALAVNGVWAARNVEALRPMRVGEAAPQFKLAPIEGGPPISLAGLKGRVVVLEFWATWCQPCMAMMPVLHHIYDEWTPQGVALIGVDSDGGDITPGQLRAFARQHQIPYPIVMDDGTVNALYKVRALPHVVIIGRDGVVVRTFLGYTGHDTLARAIREAAGKN